MLRVSDLKAGYKRIQVLQGVSLEVKKEEIITLIGANGAGKTTLMRTICGLLSPMAGVIEYEGEMIHRKPPWARVKKGLILVPEGRSILKRMTVYENLLMGAYARSDHANLGKDLEDVFERFPALSRRKDLSADVLSGGEQQMLAIGRALMARPRLLMMDEPSLGLSPILVEHIFAIIAELHRSGITILLVEQNALKALQVADRGYVIETGMITMADSAQGLLDSETLQEAYLGGEGSDLVNDKHNHA